jgi:Leucine-rich repeat (LRR) protein
VCTHTSHACEVMDFRERANQKKIRKTLRNALIKARNTKKCLIDGIQPHVIPDEFFAVPNLESMTIRDTFVTELPSTIGNLTCLQSLSIISNKRLPEIPPAIGNLVNLADLTVNAHTFEGHHPMRIPTEIGLLVKLKNLDLSNNNLVSVPPEIRYLVKLTWLNISHNRLKFLPAETVFLPVLEHMHCYRNPFQDVPPSYTVISYPNRETPVLIQYCQDRLQRRSFVSYLFLALGCPLAVVEAIDRARWHLSVVRRFPTLT